MSFRPRYGSGGRRPAYGQPAYEAAWPRWRDVRPVLLKSAGIVGIAGAIMAVVSSNALFVDPGGPPRGASTTASAAEEPGLRGSAIVLPASAVTLAGDDAPATTASTAVRAADIVSPPAPPPDVAPVEQPPAPVVVATVDPRSTATDGPDTGSIRRTLSPAGLPAADAAAPAPAGAENAQTPSAPVAAVAPAALPSGVQGDDADAATDAEDSEAWSRDAVECPRDWVAVEGEADPRPAGCASLASLVTQSEPQALATLRKALPERVLDLTAMAPAIPVPASAKGDPDAPEAVASAEPDPAPPPKRAAKASNRSASWPAEPPPDCGSKHARWHYVQGHSGKKEWYCK